jgi:hypothetical protein
MVGPAGRRVEGMLKEWDQAWRTATPPAGRGAKPASRPRAGLGLAVSIAAPGVARTRDQPPSSHPALSSRGITRPSPSSSVTLGAWEGEMGVGISELPRLQG